MMSLEEQKKLTAFIQKKSEAGKKLAKKLLMHPLSSEELIKQILTNNPNGTIKSKDI